MSVRAAVTKLRDMALDMALMTRGGAGPEAGAADCDETRADVCDALKRMYTRLVPEVMRTRTRFCMNDLTG